jgi:hypothetical protein
VINSALYKDPVLLDPAQHRALRMGVLTDYSITKGMHAVFLAATEFLQAGLEFPILFVHSGERGSDGRLVLSPIVLLGLMQGENLCVKAGAWDAHYIPAFIRRFPFLTANLKGAAGPGVLIDTSWSGFSTTEGEPLFTPDDRPSPALEQAMKFLEMFEQEAQRTRMFCARLSELDILKEMKADATLPDGKTLSVDGFYTVDDEKLRDLPDATVLELHRNGMLMLLNVHLASLSNMKHLVDRKALREAGA